MNPHSELRQFLAQRATRRTFLGRTAQGIGGLALASLLNPTLLSAATATARKDKWTGAAYPLDYPQKVKRVIWLTMAGGPSHLETFDYKPKLAKMHGEPMPESFTAGKQIAQLQGQKLKCFGPQHGFKKFGRNGTEICPGCFDSKWFIPMACHLRRQQPAYIIANGSFVEIAA